MAKKKRKKQCTSQIMIIFKIWYAVEFGCKTTIAKCLEFLSVVNDWYFEYWVCVSSLKKSKI